MSRRANKLNGLEKCPTGIKGLDEITEGGLPRGRCTLVCGSAGCGKTLLAMEFLIRGITEFKEPGVLMAFEETAEELAKNVASLGFDVPRLIRNKQMAIDSVHIERSEIQETGDYNLDGLFIRLNLMIESVGARRVVLDTVEALLAGIPNEAIMRAELRRLFRWLKDKGVTAVITGEQGEKSLTRYGLEEYVSDCVIFLDHQVQGPMATRRLRIVKYRGSRHGTNNYPTLIDRNGLWVLPISSLGLSYPVSRRHVSTGVARLDGMLDGKGYFKGTSVLISGMAGTGKSSLSIAFVDAACRRGERALYFSFEESPDQIIRNMSSIGFDLRRWTRKGLLQFHSLRPTVFGLEMHLAGIHKLVKEFQPEAVVMDPITNLTSVGSSEEVKAMLTRMIDFLKNEGITAVCTSLTHGGSPMEQSEVGISSLMDTWLLVRMQESSNERNRLLTVLKSRGMSHSNQLREYIISKEGINLADVYVGPGMVLTGTARLLQEAADEAQSMADQQAVSQRCRQLQQEQGALKAQAQALQTRLQGIQQELQLVTQQEEQRRQGDQSRRQRLAASRQADNGSGGVS
jgi:circadian clock protein KaiC